MTQVKIIRRIVDNRVFLLGLDELYRETMKRIEADELLDCARETAAALSIKPADVPVEGYYSESPELTEYFLLVRALQEVPRKRAKELRRVAGFKRLRQVMESGLYGPSGDSDKLLAGGEDPLARALEALAKEAIALDDFESVWTIEKATAEACKIAKATDDFSLVALAALARDPVVLAALAETVVLQRRLAAMARKMRVRVEYVWKVSRVIQQRAARFVDTFNGLIEELLGDGIEEPLPRPTKGNAVVYYSACNEWKIVGRCVCLGFDDRRKPIRHYHWAINRDDDRELTVEEFWDTKVWTTEKYRRTVRANG